MPNAEGEINSSLSIPLDCAIHGMTLQLARSSLSLVDRAILKTMWRQWGGLNCELIGLHVISSNLACEEYDERKNFFKRYLITIFSLISTHSAHHFALK